MRFFEEIIKYGFHDTNFNSITIKNNEVILYFENGIYKLDEKGNERELIPSSKVCFKIDSRFSIEQILLFNDITNGIKDIDYSTFKKMMKNKSYGIHNLYFSNFSNSVLIDGGIEDRVIFITIEDISNIYVV